MTVILIVTGTLGEITTRFEKYVEEVGIEMRVEHVQDWYLDLKYPGSET